MATRTALADAIEDSKLRAKLIENDWTDEELDILTPPEPDNPVPIDKVLEAQRKHRCKIIFHNAAVCGIIAARQTRKEKKQKR